MKFQPTPNAAEKPVGVNGVDPVRQNVRTRSRNTPFKFHRSRNTPFKFHQSRNTPFKFHRSRNTPFKFHRSRYTVIDWRTGRRPFAPADGVVYAGIIWHNWGLLLLRRK